MAGVNSSGNRRVRTASRILRIVFRSTELWRIVLSSVIYFTFGGIVSPIVLPYYTSLSYGLRMPGFEVLAPLEIFRGFLYVIALLPLLAALRVQSVAVS